MTRQEGSFDHIVAIHPIAIMTLEVPFEGRGDIKLEVILQGWREWGRWQSCSQRRSLLLEIVIVIFQPQIILW